MNRPYAWIAAALTLAACSPTQITADSGVDTGASADVASDRPTPTDTGTDSGVEPTDSGVSTDSGVTPTDSGIAPADSGVAPADSGVAPTDSGVAPTDSGVAPTDSGVAPADSGVAPTDSGVATGPSYATAVQPILQARCSPCHTGGGSGGWDVSMYTSTQLASYYASGRTKGGAFIVRVRDGSMPAGRGCTGNPAMDMGNAACLTATEQMTLEAWATGGQRP